MPHFGQDNVVRFKWVFHIKYNPYGSIQRNKARLVAKGFQQNPSIDFNETYSPGVKASTIKTALSIAIHYNWPIKQLNFDNALLNGHLNEIVFMFQCEGFEDAAKPRHI